jgi:hypothetical protein
MRIAAQSALVPSRASRNYMMVMFLTRCCKAKGIIPLHKTMEGIINPEKRGLK